MGESAPGAPAAPAAAPIPAAAQPATPAPASNEHIVSAPPPASQAPLSVSEAGRMLAAKRRQDAAQAPLPPARAPAPQPTPAAAPAAPAAAATDSYDTIARALGLDQGATPAPDGAPAPEAPGAGFELDGHRYTPQQLRAAIGQAADYTKKTQELAVQRQQLQQQAEALAQVLPHIQPELARLGQQLQGAQPPDHALIDTNPQEYLRQMHAYQQAAQEQQRLGQLTALQQEAYQRAMSQQVEAGNKVLAEKYEFWRDDAARAGVQRDIAAWAQSKGGYNRQELQGLSDPRHVESMMKAMMWDRMVEGAKTTSPRRLASASVRGTAPPPAPSAALASAEEAFSGAPNVRNAAALLSAQRRAAANGGGRY